MLNASLSAQTVSPVLSPGQLELTAVPGRQTDSTP